MNRISRISVVALAMLAGGATMAQDSLVRHYHSDFHYNRPGGHHHGYLWPNNPVAAPWMSSEVGDAWRQGYRGQGTTITVIDQFNGPDTDKFEGNLSGKVQTLLHGQWTAMEAGMVAPQARVQRVNYTTSLNALPLYLSLIHI